MTVDDTTVIQGLICLQDKGYEGYVSFESKINLIAHYKQMLLAELLFGNIMVIGTNAAAKLVNSYIYSMPRDNKQIEFSTTRRQLSDKDFEQVSEWIAEQKKKSATKKWLAPKTSSASK